MTITASAVSLNVADPAASAEFATHHLGFREDMAADGFVSLSRADAGFNLIFLRIGLTTFKPDSMRDRHADGLLVVFVVDDVDAECERLQQERVAITTPLQTEPWGERFFQVCDPNGVIVQFVQWVTTPTGWGRSRHQSAAAGRTYRDGGSEMRVLLSTYTAGAWL